MTMKGYDYKVKLILVVNPIRLHQAVIAGFTPRYYQLDEENCCFLVLRNFKNQLQH